MKYFYSHANLDIINESVSVRPPIFDALKA